MRLEVKLSERPGRWVWRVWSRGRVVKQGAAELEREAERLAEEAGWQSTRQEKRAAVIPPWAIIGKRRSRMKTQPRKTWFDYERADRLMLESTRWIRAAKPKTLELEELEEDPRWQEVAGLIADTYRLRMWAQFVDLLNLRGRLAAFLFQVHRRRERERQA